MFVFLVTLGWIIIIFAEIVQIFTAILNLLVVQGVALPSILKSMNDIFQKSIFKQEQILNHLTGNIWIYTIISLTIFVALFVITLVSFQLHRVRKGQLITKPYIKIIFITLIIFSLIYGKVAVLILAALMFIGLLFIESSLFDVESLQNFVEERNMIVIYYQNKKLEREVNKEGKYHGSATMAVDATIAGIKEIAKNFKSNDYAKEDDNKKLSGQKSNSIFSSNDLNYFFNVKRNDVDENELANLINYMTKTMTNPQKSSVVEPELATAGMEKSENSMEEESEALFAANREELETIALNNEPKIKTTVVSAMPVIDITANNEHKVVSFDIEVFVDKTAVLNEEGNVDTPVDEISTFSCLDNDIFNSSLILEKIITKKQKKLYNKWNKMYQQALKIKKMVEEEEVKGTKATTKLIKKKVKIYNLFAQEVNKLVKKLKLKKEHDLKLMRITEIFGNNSQTTFDFFNNHFLETYGKMIKIINDIVDDNIINIVNNDKVKKEIEIMNNDIKITKQASQKTEITFIPYDHNIDKLKRELLTNIQSFDDTEMGSNHVPNNYLGYHFNELEGLDDFQGEYVDAVASEDHHIDETEPVENNEPIKEYFESFSIEVITTEPADLSAVKEEEIKPEFNFVSDDEIKADAINLELASEPLAIVIPIPVKADFINTMIDEKLADNEEVNEDKLEENNEENYRDQTLFNNDVPNETTTVLQSEIKSVLKEEISYSLDELDDKIMNGDFSNLDDEVIKCFDIEQPELIQEPEVKFQVMVENKKSLSQQPPLNNFEFRFEKIEELIKNSIDSYTVHTKTLGEIQEYLKNLTIKIETLKTKTTDIIKKNKDIKKKKHIKHHGVVPIDQFYKHINNINLTSTRYNLYNKKGYSNTYRIINSKDISYGLGSYYRTNNGCSYQNVITGNNSQFVDYNHFNLHSISKYTKQDITFEANCSFCKKNK
ncbi:hypothetical protein [Spiroplasma endosymbiont of Polydrusus formosus]|uniref:hypothetical protein n=1 Tax=Spiroplasma endosymbiont of Polydrusus formosus TaxID=3139326 RepID=UPI0035B511E8